MFIGYAPLSGGFEIGSGFEVERESRPPKQATRLSVANIGARMLDKPDLIAINLRREHVCVRGSDLSCISDERRH